MKLSFVLVAMVFIEVVVMVFVSHLVLFDVNALVQRHLEMAWKPKEPDEYEFLCGFVKMKEIML